jgi:hypothetical protein
MGWAKSIRFLLKPSVLLGFLLFTVWFLAFSLLLWERTGLLLFTVPVRPFGLDRAQGVVIAAALAAVTGWIVTAIVTIRNLRKQHTITTLLQSRLSATYMENVKAVNASFTLNGKIIPITQAEIESPPPTVNLGALGYILNYLEFIALGIRHGDLDEGVMKSSLRGILCDTVTVARLLIEDRRKPNHNGRTPSVYEHLMWLNARWGDPGLTPQQITRPSTPTAQSKEKGWRQLLRTMLS